MPQPPRLSTAKLLNSWSFVLAKCEAVVMHQPTCVYIYIYTCTCRNKESRSYMYRCMYVCIYIYLCLQIVHTYVYMYISTYAFWLATGPRHVFHQWWEGGQEAKDRPINGGFSWESHHSLEATCPSRWTSIIFPLSNPCLFTLCPVYPPEKKTTTAQPQVASHPSKVLGYENHLRDSLDGWDLMVPGMDHL